MSGPNQSELQAAIRRETGDAQPFEGDWHALWDLRGIPPGTFDERLLAYINVKLGTSYKSLNTAQIAMAKLLGVRSWHEVTELFGISYALQWAGNDLFWGDRDLEWVF